MKSLKKWFFCLPLFALTFNTSYSQTGKIGQYFIAGVELGYFNDIQSSGYRYHELTSSMKAGMNLYRSLFAGVQVNLLHTRSNWSGSKNYLIKDFFLQYDFLPQKRLRLLVESSISHGNYCTCERSEPYVKEDLIYIGYGLGVAYPIKNSGFHISGSLKLHTIVNQPPPVTNYNLLKMGVYYLFGKNKMNY